MGNSLVQLVSFTSIESVHSGLRVRLQHLTDSRSTDSAIICRHQSNIKAVICVSAFGAVIKANSPAIYLRCVNIAAFSVSQSCLMLAASHHRNKKVMTVPDQSVCECVCEKWCVMALGNFTWGHKTCEIGSILHSLHMNHCSLVTLPLKRETEGDTKAGRKWV